LENVKTTLVRFFKASSKSKAIKINSRVKSTQKYHRHFYWYLCKKLNRREIHTRKFEKYVIPLSDESLGKHLYINGQFDIEKLIKVKNLINLNERTLIDVGANIGPICIPAVQRNIVRNAIAIEPDKISFEFLNRNLSLNKIDRIKVLNVIAGSEDRTETFGSKRINLGDSKVLNEKNKFEFSETYSVGMITLNSLVQGVDPDKYLIWMDVQGFEPYVIEGASKFTAVKTPMVVEIFPLGISDYTNFEKLWPLLKNYSQFANLKYDINQPVFETMDNFELEYLILEKEKGYSDFLFI
jgi:FkbM family methyltransferase